MNLFSLVMPCAFSLVTDNSHISEAVYCSYSTWKPSIWASIQVYILQVYKLVNLPRASNINSIYIYTHTYIYIYINAYAYSPVQILRKHYIHNTHTHMHMHTLLFKYWLCVTAYSHRLVTWCVQCHMTCNRNVYTTVSRPLSILNTWFYIRISKSFNFNDTFGSFWLYWQKVA